MKRYLITLFLATLIPALGMSQNATDALRYSRLQIGGTARYMSMGGAFGALGADFTNLSTNPGGLGLYRSSEFVFTPSVHVGASNSTYNGFSGSDSKTNFALGNVGYVFTRPLTGKNSSGFDWD